MNWLVPALTYVVAVGVLGVWTKLALRTLTWQELLPWTATAWLLAVGALMAMGQTRFTFEADTMWAIGGAVVAVGSLFVLYLALSEGEASKVVPVTAAYPAVTLLLSGIFLAERISLARVGGMLLVITGVVILSAAR